MEMAFYRSLGMRELFSSRLGEWSERGDLESVRAELNAEPSDQ